MQGKVDEKQQTSSKRTRSVEQKVRTRRLFVIDEAIRTGRYPNTDKLAALLEVNFRTIQRDIEYMRDMFRAPIEYSAVHRGYYYSEPNFYLKSIPLTEGELFSLALFNPLLEQYRNTPLENDLRQIFSKIIQSLPDTITVDTSFLSEQVSFIPDHAATIDQKVFKTVLAALRERRTISFDYRSLQQKLHTRRRADPYHAICQQGNWYVIGYCHERKEPRMFSLSRMRNITLTADTFAIPTDFDPHEYFDKEMGVWASSRTPYTVELLIDDEIATYALERKWHNTQKVEQRDDGTVYVRFTTTQMPEVLRWVLGQGHTVRVLGPEELVGMVKAEGEKVRGMYERQFMPNLA
jgi:predicted DNA-binding transcriptional regulator YafY